MPTNGLTLASVSDRLSTLFQRMLALHELIDLATDKLPNNTDSDTSQALLFGGSDMLKNDTRAVFKLGEDVEEISRLQAHEAGRKIRGHHHA